MTQKLGFTPQQAAFNALRAGSPQVAAMAHFQKRAPEALADFYPLAERRHDTRPNVNVEGCDLVGYFLSSVTQFAFDDVALIRMIHQIAAYRPHPISSTLFNNTSYFLGGQEPRHGRDGSTELTNVSYEGFLQFLAAFQSTMSHYASLLGQHELFSDRETVITQAGLIRDIIRESTFNIVSSAMNVYLPEEFKPLFDDPEKHVFESRTANPFELKCKFLKHLGLDKHVEYFLTLALFIEGVIRSHRDDALHRGVLPEFEASDSGLTFEFEEFSHAQRGTNDFIAIAPWYHSNVGKILSKKGLLLSPSGIDKLKWREGLSKEELIGVLEEMNLDEEIRAKVLKNYDESAFQPFGHIRMNAHDRIKILTGANSRGKTTLMKTIADQLHMAMMGRRVPCKTARLSLCDGIFHDFDVRDDLSKGISRFRAQMRNVANFLAKATPNSLGLFDELYHGTNSAYLLALAWATIEAFSRRNLRAIIATHEPLLTRVTSSDGYASIQGLYHRPAVPSAGGDGVAGVGNISLGPDYRLDEGAVTDSDAFRIAEEENFPREILDRAREILRHITSRA